MLLDGRSTTAGQPFKGHGSQGWTRRQGATERGQAAWGSRESGTPTSPRVSPCPPSALREPTCHGGLSIQLAGPNLQDSMPEASRICPDAARPPQISITGSMFGVEPSADLGHRKALPHRSGPVTTDMAAVGQPCPWTVILGHRSVERRQSTYGKNQESMRDSRGVLKH